MIINPIIPIWLMSIICIVLILIVTVRKPLKTNVNNKDSRLNQTNKQHIYNILVKLLIIICLFLINLRFMIPNGESTILTSDYSVLFVIDTSFSMRALDYNGNNERFEGVVNDCCTIVEELSSCKFSIITFGDSAKKVIPFTTDTDMVQAELKAITLEDDLYASGTTINIVKDLLEETLEQENEKQNGEAKFIVFFISDGEITVEDEELESFSTISTYITDGAVLGYGTKTGGKMVAQSFADNPSSPYYYVYYYDDNYNKVTALSKLDEANLNQLANDMGIDYIHMTQTSNIDDKLDDIKKQIQSSSTTEETIDSYQDTYYFLAVPLIILFLIDLWLKKRRM